MALIQIAIMAYTLFLLMDAVGNIPLFLTTLKGISPKRHRFIILREMTIALVVMIFFNYLGDALLSALQISQAAVLISGGVILFLLSLKMIFPSSSDPYGDEPSKKEPLIVPLAIPLVAGPATLAMIMLYSRQAENPHLVIASIVIAWAASVLILLSASFLQKILGSRGITACEKLVGLLTTMIGVQMLLQGISKYLSS